MFATQTRWWFVASSFALTIMCSTARAGQETVLHDFLSGSKDGFAPQGLLRTPEGDLYGTTTFGGRKNSGTVFKVDRSGRLTVLYRFTGKADGAQPSAGVVGDSAGNLYGTTPKGGAHGAGVIFKLDPAGHEAVLYSFTGQADGSSPSSGVVRDTAGNLYGTNVYGGAGQKGVVFKLAPDGALTVLHAFTGGSDGDEPLSGVVLDSAGNLYGTTNAGGSTSNNGIAYRLDPAGNETILHVFTGRADGGGPVGSLILDSAGNLCGTTQFGGAHRWGAVFQVGPAGQETILYSFTGGPEGGAPKAGVARDSAGDLYGTTSTGRSGNRSAFKLSPAGELSVLHHFNLQGDWTPGPVTADEAGNVYGTTQGGPADAGYIYEIASSRVFSRLHTFIGPADGAGPAAGITLDGQGNMYGTTVYGGAGNAGTVYKIDTSGEERVLHNFTGGYDGGAVNAGVVLDSSGNLYGTASKGGLFGGGIVYKMDSAGNEVVLHAFEGGSDGLNPESGVVFDANGNLYGTTAFGGSQNWGTLFKIDSAGRESVLYTFTGIDYAGAQPSSGVVLDAAGNLYCTTFSGGASNYGTVYKVDLAGNGSILLSFNGANGGHPSGSLAIDPSGDLYGATLHGGADDNGAVFKLDTEGNETVLSSFAGTNGAIPVAGVTLDASGNLYGTTQFGGAQDKGVAYEIDANGRFTVLQHFGGVDGYEPSGLTVAPSGNLLGTTYAGGKWGGGVIFELQPAPR